jgi:integrase
MWLFLHANTLRLSIPLKYCYTRGNTLIFQQPVLKELQAHYGRTTIKVNLHAANVAEAARQIEALSRQLEKDWESLRAHPDSSLKATKKHDEAFLAACGITVSGGRGKEMEHAIELLHEHLDKKRIARAQGDEEVYREAGGDEYLTKAESTAMQMLAGTFKDSLSDAFELYLEHHKKRAAKKFSDFSHAAFQTLIDAVGDKLVESLSRADARSFVTKQQASGRKTGTIRRRLSTINAVINAYISEKELTRTNPFESLQIAGECSDTKKRVPFTPEELAAVQAKCRSMDDSIRWLIALLSDTGARIGEVTGLLLDELILDGPLPHIVIKAQPWRSLKNTFTAREVPLLGSAIWAAQRIKESARPDQRFALPKYTNEQQCNADTASATVAKWLRANGWQHTAHELRHTMADPLGEVNCPDEVRHAIGGWVTQGEAAKYGTGYGLNIKWKWLDKAITFTTSQIDDRVAK